MQALADTADCAIAMGIADRLTMIYVAVCNGTGPMILRLGVGSRVPIALTSMGRAYRSEEHTSELQSLMRLSYAVFCLKKKKTLHTTDDTQHTTIQLTETSQTDRNIKRHNKLESII